MSLRARILLCVLSGVIDPLGFTGFGFFPLTWIAKVPGLLAVRYLSPRLRLLWSPPPQSPDAFTSRPIRHISLSNARAMPGLRPFINPAQQRPFAV